MGMVEFHVLVQQTALPAEAARWRDLRRAIMRTEILMKLIVFLALAASLGAQQLPPAPGGGRKGPRGNPKDTEVWDPEPKVITPGATDAAPPSDAIVLFDGKNLDEWVSTRDKSPAPWIVKDGVLVVSKARGSGNIETKRTFRDFQLHVEWKIPPDVTGKDQERGNSGIFLASTGGGDSGYELQILDSYNNRTYANGQAGSIYKQGIPLVNPARKPGEWQTYEVIWMAPGFNEDGSVKTPANVTVFFNGVLVQNHFELAGETLYIGKPFYKKYDRAPIKLQAHPDPSPAISFRNIWVRELD